MSNDFSNPEGIPPLLPQTKTLTPLYNLHTPSTTPTTLLLSKSAKFLCLSFVPAVALSTWARLRIGSDAASRYMSVAANSTYDA